MTLKNSYSIFAAALMMLFASCSSDTVLTDSGVDNGGEEEIVGVTGTIPVMKFDDTRSSLVFSSTGMTFSWDEGDQIRVYPKLTDPDAQAFSSESLAPPLILTLMPGTIATKEGVSVTGQFGNAEGERVILEAQGTTDYLTFSPANPKAVEGEIPETGYDEIPVSYLNQKQASNVKMGYYGKDNDVYMASEKAASAHLGAYDYLHGEATQTSNGSTHFVFNHLQSTVRFYMKVPENALQVFDKIMLYCKHDITNRHFTTEGHFNIGTKTFTKNSEADVLTLQFGDEGFDLNGEDKADYYYADKGFYVIVAYMEVYPVDLVEEHIRKPTLYLCGHRIIEGKRYETYYKAELTKKNLKAGYAYQWSSEVDEEEPITFTEITVQQWEEETGYNNGENGSGTNVW